MSLETRLFVGSGRHTVITTVAGLMLCHNVNFAKKHPILWANITHPHAGLHKGRAASRYYGITYVSYVELLIKHTRADYLWSCTQMSTAARPVFPLLMHKFNNWQKYRQVGASEKAQQGAQERHQHAHRQLLCASWVATVVARVLALLASVSGFWQFGDRNNIRPRLSCDWSF